MTKVFANGRSILHEGDGLKHTAAAPDVCKTPSPGGPIPVPYVNVASDSDLAKGTTTVHIEGHSVALASSNLSTSMGDEPGTAGGGLVSSKTKGKLTWGSSSIDVKFEGKGVARFMDVTQHNGNSFNTAFMSQGGTGFAYGDDFQGLCPICQNKPDEHAVLELKEEEQSLDIANKILKDLQAREEKLRRHKEDLKKEETKRRRLDEQPTKPKPSTIAEREKAIADLEKELPTLEKHRRGSSGYMFGVMVCINKEKFAAISGDETPDGFKEIARSHGCEVIDLAATLGDILARNPNKDLASQIAIRDRWRATMRKHLATPKPEQGYNNRPGACAGAKLIGRSGHVAHSMSEMYFSPSGANKDTLTFNVIYRGPDKFAPENKPWTPPTEEELKATKDDDTTDGKRVNMRRKKESTVLSCQSCQDTLFMARCDKERQTCTGK
ncbi:PAAR-like domain-containing protein [Hyalangium sp.]|uniref:PAAR-like domain-containing protein n=1 Tax=Hyalangium sp. TaxID=2028555 RepID=UPI002D308F1E|nr:PAAR-like domain-containing protein [Hyalangium sp.]HYH98000.1 PAAR-like domain-containing protein [Hyalangium sp.]